MIGARIDNTQTRMSIYPSIFICPESTKTQYVNHIGQDSETTMVLKTAINT